MVKNMVKKRRLNPASGKGKSRDRSPPSGDEVLSARDRFKGALQHLLPHSEEESESSDEDNWSSKKRLSIRKKQKNTETEKSESDSTKFQQSFVMKLFDRSVDLAQFNENTPLYPICRAWIANQPHQTYNINNNTIPEKPQPSEHEPYILKDEKDFDPLRDVNILPPPDRHVKGNVKIRVPKKIQNNTMFKTMYKDGAEVPSKEMLLKDNLAHWIKVRRSWLDAAAENEKRYQSSFKLLSAMFNRAQRHFQM
ncbi:hypothetical protein O3M35_010450 [Rhynocoris fuscipes]|uniref:Protein lin-37 homolog n=1 Tax=Rhynocoris fuscipes TaxID=488301 RepID=A0AAW1CYW6_9HEMI